MLPYSDTTDAWKPYASLVERHEVVNRKLCDAYRAVEPVFVFGSAVAHLDVLSLSFHYGKGEGRREERYDDYFWPFAIYPQEILARHVVLRELASTIGERWVEEQCGASNDHPALSLRAERLPLGTRSFALCLWSPLASASVDGRYAERLGLTSILDLPCGPSPDKTSTASAGNG